MDDASNVTRLPERFWDFAKAARATAQLDRERLQRLGLSLSAKAASEDLAFAARLLAGEARRIELALAGADALVFALGLKHDGLKLLADRRPLLAALERVEALLPKEAGL